MEEAFAVEVIRAGSAVVAYCPFFFFCMRDEQGWRCVGRRRLSQAAALRSAPCHSNENVVCQNAPGRLKQFDSVKS